MLKREAQSKEAEPLLKGPPNAGPFTIELNLKGELSIDAHCLAPPFYVKYGIP